MSRLVIAEEILYVDHQRLMRQYKCLVVMRGAIQGFVSRDERFVQVEDWI